MNPSPAQPNILLIVMDDHRADAMSCAANSVVRTPALDRLAADGTRFTRAHNMGSMLPAVCVPSRAMLHTGRNLWHLEDHGRRIPDAHPMLGETLAKSGYDCHIVGKWHNDAASLARSFHSGAEIYFGSPCDPWNAPLCDYDPSGLYECWKPVCINPELSNRTFPARFDHTYPGRHCSEVFADAAIDFLRSRPADGSPFFLNIAFTAPHDPRLAPPEWHEQYPADDIPTPPNFLPLHPFENGELAVRDELLAPTPRTPEVVRSHLSDYYAMLAHADAQIGRILDALDAGGHADHTLVVHTSDHGIALGSHGLMGKQSLYRHSTNVPLILRGPGIPGGETRDALCYHFDLFATLCEIAGADAPTTLHDSKSLLPAMRDPDHTHRETLTLAYRDNQRAILRTDGKKLIRCETASGIVEQRFDLAQDPDECHTLPDSQAHADLRAVLQSAPSNYGVS